METIPEDRQQRYTLWKKNTKLLYDYLNTNSFKWPSLSCQFFPDLDTSSDTHRLLFTSFTSSQLPQDENVTIASISTLRHVPWSSLNNFDMDEMEFKPDLSTKLPPKNLQIQLTINFPHGDCNRATYLPQNPDLISTASSDGSVYIFDRTKRGKSPISHLRGPFEAQLLPNNNGSPIGETVALDWNRQIEGILASTYSNGQLCIWDIKKFEKRNPIMSQPSADFIDTESQGFNDVSWMPSHDCLLSIAREDNIMTLFDTRTNGNIAQTGPSTNHASGINCTKFNPSQPLLVATASGDGLVQLWDIRKLHNPIKTINCESPLSALEWNPQLPTVLATGGQEDGLVKLWNASNGQLLFTHGGHMLGVNDIAWSPHDKWLMCSVANDNSTHLWKPASRLVT
ncbi:ZYRO0A13068p [Zygosaccharomyces rouxii]|uniref:ZYRO0A13068p n=1 Tax=Zygosaccharomyces rouxii (strain ATCC 2623 / CBS 732 / NBRC 1130 / NCYC 568 / NRRL Y-229) TaxID=559307 RepID=C5DP02_ZYGRC|nr:uncharacterized protein ZYRO0A13068g [Zygosaccharomyces rouxii]KAH9198484.1 WD40-repeat-containing domain protein [Zygosaccharomyces rouxii]CAR25993.1 ZYRO0A13068p [Zygosaccharomyces rouxii]